MDVNLPTTAARLGNHFNAAVIGDEEAEIREIRALERMGPGALSYCTSKKHAAGLRDLSGGVVFTMPELAVEGLRVTFVVVSDPKSAFASVARTLARTSEWEGISPQALIHPTAKIGPGVAVGPFAVIGAGAVIGRDSVVASFVSIGRDVTVGEKTHLYARVTLMDGVTVGSRVKIFPGAVIGADGFGLVPGVELEEMPQLGSVVIEDDVRIGANCTIDRGTLGDTRIGAGSKLDDQVHIGHNSEIGRNCILCGQVGLAGSVILEDNVVLGGQAGVTDHVRVGKGARIGGQSGVGNNLEGGQDYFMSPAMPLMASLRTIKVIRQLPALAERLKRLERKWEDRS